MEVTQSHVPPHAKSRAAGNRVGQHRKGRPAVFVKLADGDVTPIATGPLGGRLFKFRQALSTPGSQEWPLLRNAKRDLQKIGIQKIVVVYEDQQIVLGLAHPSEPSRSET